MKIAITSQGKTMDSLIDPRLGRSRGFIIADEEGEEYEYVDNAQNLSAASGAGIQAAQNIINLGVEMVITGNCGPKAFSVLSTGNVKIYTGASGTVREALGQFKKGELIETEDANVQGHWV